ncbi:fungal-specific transcription factor domain-containing protein [Aspergillus carlsbadensis]|nr:fungal-specific transcription factor domain-containing protein [Aspergillus carlsbadensis]
MPDAAADSAAKRSAPETEDDRVPKRRAARACVYCRTRKVRCDVLSGGRPCTNCKLDGLECQLAHSVRSRRFAGPRSPARPLHPDPLSVAHAEHRTSPEQFPVSLTFEEPLDLSRENDDENLGHSPSLRSPDNLSSHPSTAQPQPHGLPRYIRSLPPRISGYDVEYLARKDALTIPDDSLRDELLKHYIKIVHPLMPILELNDFITPILRDDGIHQVSLLLFQAVMFVGVSFVDFEMLRLHGYTSRKSARKHFFRRVHLLYGLDCEPDRIALVQALLLMTYWYDTPEDEKDTWYWMGLAFSLAQVIGLHRDPEHLRLSPKAKHHRKRLWWSCLMRDRLLALGIRRPARIRPDDFDVPMLTLDDLEPGPVSDELVALVGAWESPGDADARQAMATLCIELARLCLCVGHILLSQYSVLESPPLGTGPRGTAMVFPRKTPEQVQELSNCDTELDRWFVDLAPCCRYTPQYLDTQEPIGMLNGLVTLHRTSLYMIYLMALGALHRPQVFSTTSILAQSPEGRDMSREKVTAAAVAVTQLAYDIQLRDHLRYLSTSSIPAFTSAALIHLLDIRSTREETRNISIGRFCQCMQMLSQLQEMYASADYAVYFLETVIQQTKVQFPMFWGLRGLGRSSQPRRPSDRVRDITYPTPSSSGHRRGVAEESPSVTYGALNNEFTHPSGASAAQPVGVMGFQYDGDDVSQNGLAEDVTRHNNWNEMDSLLCALVNFETDPNFSI